MSDQPRTIYSIDTSSLVTVQRTYPLAVFPGIWEQLSELARDGRLVAPREVYNELERGGDDEIFQWAKAHKFVFCDPDEQQIDLARQIVNDTNYQGLFDVDGEMPDADPYVIALGVVRQKNSSLLPEHWVVVADESRAQPGKKPKIPDVCKDFKYKIECIHALDLFKREGWEFVRKAPGGGE